MDEKELRDRLRSVSSDFVGHLTEIDWEMLIDAILKPTDGPSVEEPVSESKEPITRENLDRMLMEREIQSYVIPPKQLRGYQDSNNYAEVKYLSGEREIIELKEAPSTDKPQADTEQDGNGLGCPDGVVEGRWCPTCDYYTTDGECSMVEDEEGDE